MYATHDMDELQKYYAQWKKLNNKYHKIYLCEISRKSKDNKDKKSGQDRRQRLTVKVHEVPFWAKCS